MRRLAVAVCGWVALAACGGFSAETSAGARRPNVLFIITDQQFADAMSCRMGDRYIQTPNMDSLARRGVLFTRAYSSNPLCIPYRNSVFTGRYPHELGITCNDHGGVTIDTAANPCLGVYFRNAGYDTAYSGKWHLAFKAKDAASHGFEIMASPKSKANHDDGVTDGAVTFLRRPHDKPFLLVASYLNPHNICEWSRRLAGRKQALNCGEVGEPPPAEQLPPAPANLAPQRDEPDSLALMRRAFQVDTGPFPVGHYTEMDWRRHRWGYYRMIELVDAQIGKLLQALREAGQEENTAIVFTADHGECAGAHGWNQKTVFFDESARVPLIVAATGCAAGTASDKLVNTGVDLLPTMLAAAGLPVPDKLPGRSLMPLVSGQPVAGWRDCVVVENNLVQSGVVDGLKPEMEGRMVRSERYKYCVFSRGERRESLVDMQDDPGETVNRAADPALRDVLAQHRERLARFGREHGDPLAEKLLADGVKPIPFDATTALPQKAAKAKGKK
jgi:arylsulfatase A-like enzyme